MQMILLYGLYIHKVGLLRPFWKGFIFPSLQIAQYFVSILGNLDMAADKY